MTTDNMIYADDPMNDTTAEIAGRWSELLKPRYLASTITLCLGVALFAFNEFFVSTALPTAVEELGGAALLSWAITFYLVFAIIGGMTAANLKQRFGARLTLLAAAALFVVGTMLAVTATAMPQVLVGRLLQGAGEGVVAALCYALIPELFPSRLVPKVFGAEAIVWASAAFAGPLVAGGLTEHISWRAAFFISVPAAALFCLLVLVIVPRAGAAPSASRPIPFLRLAAAGCGILLISVSAAMELAGLQMLFLTIAALILVVSVRLDRRSLSPVLPSAAFSFHRSLGTGLWVVFLMPLFQSVGAVFIVYSLQHLWGLGPMAAGGLSAVMAIFWSLVAIGVASIPSHGLRNRITQAGPVLLAFGLAVLVVALWTGVVWLIPLAQALIGSAFGICWGTLSQLMMDVSSDAERDRTSAMLPTLQSAGYAIGAAVWGFVANASGFAEAAAPDTIRHAMLVVFSVSAILSLSAIWFGFRTIRLARVEDKL